MKIKILCQKEWNKLDNTCQQIIYKRCNETIRQINQYDNFNKIFNNDSLIYKAYPKNFFIVKNSGTFQVRLLCRYAEQLEIHKIYIKNGKHPMPQNIYIQEFTNYVNNYEKGE